jgi:hypothetical protein
MPEKFIPLVRANMLQPQNDWALPPAMNFR